jgi:hypothetical protein
VTKIPGNEGTYAVVFSHDVTECAYEGTIGRSSTEATEFPGYVTVVRWASNPDGVYVQTYSPANNGTLTDKGFHLAVLC